MMHEKEVVRMEPLTKEEMEIAKSFCSKEKDRFWLCIYQIARNIHELPFMIVKESVKEDLSGPIGCLINMKREFEDEMDKIISEESTESMEEMEILVQNYNIAIDVLEEANTKL